MPRKTTPRAPQPRRRGQVVHRGGDTYLVRVPRGTEPGTGKRLYHNETVKGTRRDAEKALTRILRDLDAGDYIAPAKDTVSAFASTWLSTKEDVLPKTRHGYQMRLEGDILPILGNLKLDKVTPMDVQGVIDACIRKGLSPRTVHLTYGVLAQMLEQAISWGIIGKNPAKGVRLPKIKRREISVLTPEQVGVLLETTKGTRYHALWALMLTTGLRPSEAACLRWSDFDGEKVYINRSLTEQRGIPGQPRTWLPDDTKTETSRRSVVLFGMAVRALEAHHQHQREDMLKRGFRNPEGLIFVSSKGGYPRLDNLAQLWAMALEKAGLPKVRMYDQRHTHATHLLLAGEHPKVVQERLGHGDVSITLNTYSSVLPAVHKESAARAEAKLNYGVA